ncbi:hypothetical protein P152DRAFT_493435 [Eremomyces bilateralis CBS 781.70]|uniref:Uncharacterized protein n=1 Tax=Eremomyces bilateralis CBS 781.70 TaxID=1392243 RepID=A0A6G1FWW6_9PEZI|nr:uncharacterized protein P152DRAFT_493435 [Eremomyces bilateralis CBS 781.70]KAF1810119.1 hypothetical protein P152DRAFT_493435 [Eremomyces bilateralis CBS 781.70]
MDYAERLNEISTKSHELSSLPTCSFSIPTTLPIPVNLLDVTQIHSFDPLYPALRREALRPDGIAFERRAQASQLLKRNGIRQKDLPEWEWVRFVCMKRGQQEGWMGEWWEVRRGVRGGEGERAEGGPRSLVEGQSGSRNSVGGYGHLLSPMTAAGSDAARRRWSEGGNRRDTAIEELVRGASLLDISEHNHNLGVDRHAAGGTRIEDEEPPSYEEAMEMVGKPPGYLL